MSSARRWISVLAVISLGGAHAARCAPEPQYRPLAEKTGQQYGLPAWMLSALVQAESEFCSRAVSPTGAQGLGQLMPGTARDLGVTNAFDPVQNLGGAARYLRAQYLAFGSWPLALAAYNAGPGAVIQYQGIPPYAETQQYVQKVLGLYAAYSGQATTVTAAAPQPPRPLTVPSPDVSGGVPVPSTGPGAAPGVLAARPLDSSTPSSAAPPGVVTVTPGAVTVGPPQWLGPPATGPQKPLATAPQPPRPEPTTQTTTLRRAASQAPAQPITTVLTSVLHRSAP